jgi:hypothetical protein
MAENDQSCCFAASTQTPQRPFFHFAAISQQLSSKQ